MTGTARSLDAITLKKLDEMVEAANYHLQKFQRLRDAITASSDKTALNHALKMTDGSADRLREAVLATGTPL